MRQNLNDGPAPQYDFCGQRGPTKREMSLRDSAGPLLKPEVALTKGSLAKGSPSASV